MSILNLYVSVVARHPSLALAANGGQRSKRLPPRPRSFHISSLLRILSTLTLTLLSNSRVHSSRCAESFLSNLKIAWRFSFVNKIGVLSGPRRTSAVGLNGSTKNDEFVKRHKSGVSYLFIELLGFSYLCIVIRMEPIGRGSAKDRCARYARAQVDAAIRKRTRGQCAKERREKVPENERSEVRRIV